MPASIIPGTLHRLCVSAVLMLGLASASSAQDALYRIVTVRISGQGTVELGPGILPVTESDSRILPAGSEVILAATAGDGWEFARWEGDIGGSDNPRSCLFEQDALITAVFLPSGPTAANSSTQTNTKYEELLSVDTRFPSMRLTPGAYPPIPPQFQEAFRERFGDAALDRFKNGAVIGSDGREQTQPMALTTIYYLTLNDPSNAVTWSPEPADTVIIVDSDTKQIPYNAGTLVTLTAPQSGAWVLDYWQGDLFSPGDFRKDSILVSMQGSRTVTAQMNYRPELVGLDMMNDLAYFLSAIGEQETISTFDRNRTSVDEDLNRIFVPNGIPDAAELFLVETVLRRRNLTLTIRSGIAHEPVWSAWQTNLARAAIELAGQDSRIQRVVAGHMTLGDFDSSVLIKTLVEQHFQGVTIDTEQYDKSQQRYFECDNAADNDGVTNLEEWQLASPNGSLSNVQAFANEAVNGVRPGTPPPPAPGAPDCELGPCMDTFQMTVRSNGHGTATKSPNGDNFPPGTSIKVTATVEQGGGYQFINWTAPDSMLNGSREESNSFPLLGDTVATANFGRASLQLPKNNQNLLILVNLPPGGVELIVGDDRYVYAPIGSVATVWAWAANVVGWVRKQCSSCADPRYSYQNPVTAFVSGYAGPVYNSQQPQTIQFAVNGSQGGTTIIATSYSWSGAYVGACQAANGSPISISANPDPGQDFSHWEPAWLFAGIPANYTFYSYIPSWLSTAFAVYTPKIEYTLKVEPTGEMSGEDPRVWATSM